MKESQLAYSEQKVDPPKVQLNQLRRFRESSIHSQSIMIWLSKAPDMLSEILGALAFENSGITKSIVIDLKITSYIMKLLKFR